MVGYYDDLGVAPTASLEQIKTAYRREARKFHPDVTIFPLVVAEAHFKKIALAYEVLSDPVRRAGYDRSLLGRTDFVTHDSPSASTRRDEPVDWYPNEEVFARVNQSWEEYSQTPYRVLRRVQTFYLRWEWAFGVVTLVLMYFLLRNGERAFTTKAMEIFFTSNDQPEASMHPLYGAVAGIGLAVLITLVTWLNSFRYQSNVIRIGLDVTFRRRMNHQAIETLMALYVLFFFAGLLVGHYLF